jgi:flagellar biosynthetic protein FliP
MKKLNYLVFLFTSVIFPNIVYAQERIPIPRVNIGIDQAKSPQDVAVTLQIIFLLTLLTLAPSILIMVTSFVRVVVVFSFVRQALGTQQLPPNQVIISLSLFLTFFIMMPAFSEIQKKALNPYLDGKITFQQALKRAEKPLRKFMFRQTRQKDLALFVKLAKIKRPKSYGDVPTFVLIPSFMISELKTAFQIGFVIFIPFLIIDMIVASTLMSMGMMLLPPILISLPFKILLFVMVDGWHLITRSLVQSFR